MMKNISIILLITILLSSCGKKGDPVYNEENQDSKIFTIQKTAIT